MLQPYKSKYIKKLPTLESELEKATLNALRSRGCLCYKFVSPTKRGVPDDIVLLPKGQTVFIEFKNPRGIGALSKLQEHQIAKIRDKGFTVFIVGCLRTADECIDECLDIAYEGMYHE